MCSSDLGVLSGILFLGEVPTWRDWLALAMIVAALALVLLLQPRRSTTPGSSGKPDPGPEFRREMHAK